MSASRQTFDPRKDLYIDSDASLVAAGACVYHLGPKGERRPVAYFSKKFSAREAKWPPYVREAYALTLALEKARDFMEASEGTPTVYVDQKPLLWLKKARSPKVVRWVVETIQDLDFRLLYKPGPDNLGADAFSRVPCVEPGVPTEVGVVAAVLRLLDTVQLPDAMSDRHSIWLAIQGRCCEIRQHLRQRNRRVLDGSPTDRMFTTDWNYAILVPDATRAPMVARRLLKQPRPFAILLPIDLLHCIYDPVCGGLDQEDRVAKARLRDAHKLVFSSDNLVWVLGNWPGSTTEVFAIELSQASGGEEPKDVRTTLLDCHFCLVARARRLMKHGEYSSMKIDSPHQAYGLDVWDLR